MNVTELFSLKGKTAVVTGGSGLYGRQMVEALAASGAEVYTASRNLASNEEYAKKMRDKGYIKRLKERNIAVFVRSVFLQGVFFLEPEKITDPLLVEYAKPYIEILRDYCKAENMSIAEFAISYIRDTEGVTSLVLGADTKEQVMENIKYINAPAISEKKNRAFGKI